MRITRDEALGAAGLAAAATFLMRLCAQVGMADAVGLEGRGLANQGLLWVNWVYIGAMLVGIGAAVRYLTKWGRSDDVDGTDARKMVSPSGAVMLGFGGAAVFSAMEIFDALSADIVTHDANLPGPVFYIVFTAMYGAVMLVAGLRFNAVTKQVQRRRRQRPA